MVARRSEFMAAGACALFGFLISTLPYWLAWSELGGPWYFPDPDCTGAYLHFVAHAYNFHPFKLADPAIAFSGAPFYNAIPFVPFILVTKALSAGPASVFLIWSAWAGAAMGLVFYAIIRMNTSKVWVAAAFAVLLLADTGLLFGRLFDRQVLQIVEVIRKGDGAFPGAWSHCLPHWRLVNPAVTWPFLGIFLWSILRLDERPTTRREIVSALSFASLWYVYFYYWTAAALALGVAFLVQPALRTNYLRVGVAGTILGLPALIKQIVVRSAAPPDWLERGAYFVKIGRFEDLLVSKIALLWLLLAAFVLWKWRNPKLTFLAIFVGAGMLIANHQVVTATQLQNFHWQYAWGPALGVLLVAILARFFEQWKRPALIAAGLVLAGHVSAGVYLRFWEGTRAEVPRKIRLDLREFLAESADASFTPGKIIAGDPDYVDFAVGFRKQIGLVGAAGLAPSVTQEQWRERRVLNAWVSGVSRAQVFRTVSEYYGCWTEIVRKTPAEQSAEGQRVEELYDRIVSDPTTWLEKYRIVYVATPSNQTNVGQGWRQIDQGQRWTLWETAAGK